jgi:D-alanyl-lipoteichoic acid acyltransferase DltB (MBOAT superfamily)
MPAGVSFFTFKLVSYVIEVDRGHLPAEKNIVTFAAYVAFFPTMMAGPIDRPNTFIPQLRKDRPFNYALALDGCRQILWGAFKKMIISDNLALSVDGLWNNISGASSINLIIGIFLYTMQVYTDFSGYSDMAIGVGKILGFNITKNFRYPFFGRNVSELWRGYHMSLTSWITDYVFMPLNIAFRNIGKPGIIFAIIINMLLVGLWHEANLTWAVFGLYNGILFVPLILSGAFTRKTPLVINRAGLPSLRDFMGMFLTFVLFSLGVLLTRADNITEAFIYFKQLFAGLPDISMRAIRGKKLIIGILVLFVFEWYACKNKAEYALSFVASRTRRLPRRLIYLAMAELVVLHYFTNASRGFIYFNF